MGLFDFLFNKDVPIPDISSAGESLSESIKVLETYKLK